MMTYEAQIVLRRNSAQQLASDVEAISEFIENLKRGTGPSPRRFGTASDRAPLRVIEGQRGT
jgi:hypothetical protein